MHVHSPHVGSAIYMHGSMEITVGCLPPQPSKCSGAYVLYVIIVFCARDYVSAGIMKYDRSY